MKYSETLESLGFSLKQRHSGRRGVDMLPQYITEVYETRTIKCMITSDKHMTRYEVFVNGKLLMSTDLVHAFLYAVHSVSK